MSVAEENKPLVSVLMTAYNREKYIAEAIESVLASAYTNFELIVVDDGSEDATVKIAQNYLLKDNRIQLHINEKNLGDYPNRNFAVTLARGKYIMFCDSDDEFYPDSISYCVGAMEDNARVSFGVYYAGNSAEPFVLSSVEAIKRHFFDDPFLVMGPGGTITKRDFFSEINGYPEKYGPANDMYFNLKVACQADILLLPNLFLHYREHEAQEKNNLYDYIHFNYSYMKDALKELPLPLSSKQIQYLQKKNYRRFSVNLFNDFRKKKDWSSVKFLWVKAGFGIRQLFQGIFH